MDYSHPVASRKPDPPIFDSQDTFRFQPWLEIFRTELKTEVADELRDRGDPVPVEEFWTAINALFEERPVVRSKDVAKAVCCTRETARVNLHELEEDGQLASVRSRASSGQAPSRPRLG